MAPNRLTRRSFLRRGAGTVLLVGAAMPACGEDDPATGADAGADAGGDTGADAAVDAVGDTAADTAVDGSDTGPDVAPDATADVADTADAAEVVSAIVKGPWVNVAGATAVALLVEMPEGAAVGLYVRKAGDTDWTELSAETSTEEVEFRWPTSEALTADYPDLPGLFTMVRAQAGGLEPGANYEWEARESGAATATGTFRTPAPAGQEFTFAWISDTMAPNSASVAELLGRQEFDLFIHGGDIQYRTALVDTWNGAFRIFAPVLRRAPSHFTIGNHEFEATGESGDIEDPEYDRTYRRLFTRQGDEGGRTEHYAFSWGHVRFIVLNSEDRFFATDGTQMTWLRDELEAVRASDTLQYAVVAFHRPYWTLSNSRPSVSDRDYLHPILREYGVPLVLTGHNHCYEHFVVDGIHYVVDGGGGALLYSPDDNLDSIEADRPGESAYRLHKAQTYGTSLVTVRADGTLELRRVNIRDEEEDRFVIDPSLVGGA